MILFVLSLFCFLSFYGSVMSRSENGYIRGCYYTNWSQYRQDRAKFLPESYLPGMCTHLFYAFAVMDSQFSVIPFEWNDESTPWSKGMYERVNDLKKLQPDLKTLLSFGGWTFSQANKPLEGFSYRIGLAGSTTVTLFRLFRTMMSSTQNRNTFIQSAIQMTLKHKFNGFDMDWEYPEAEDKEIFATLLQEMSTAFRSRNLLLTAAVAAGIARIEPGYDIPIVARSLDFVNIMTYDMHGGWEGVTGLNSPLYDRNGDELSMTNAVDYWVSHGLPKEKVVVGFASYGRGWTLTTSQTAVGSPGTQPPAGQYTREAGFFSYYEIKDLLSSGGRRFFDDVQKAPYMIKDKLWIGYDDVDSYKIKLNWLKENGYKGAFVWSLDLDDFNGASSGGETYPLIKTIANNLGGKGAIQKSRSSNAVTDPATQKPMIPVSRPDSTRFICPGPGLHPDPNSCTNFYNCNTNGDAFKSSCGNGLHFSPLSKVCDYPAKVRCTKKSTF